jgi:hypothetical protein
LEVPAGFRRLNQWQTDVAYHDSLRHSTIDLPSDTLHDDSSTPSLSPDILDVPIPPTSLESGFIQPPLSNHIPIVHSVDKTSTLIPSVITMNEDFLRASVGFRRVDTIKQHLPVLYQNTIKLDHTPADAVLASGDLANMRKTKRNTTPVPRLSLFGDIVHMDIVFGPEVAIGNIHYSLLFTDHFSRMNCIYPLQILPQTFPDK